MCDRDCHEPVNQGQFGTCKTYAICQAFYRYLYDVKGINLNVNAREGDVVGLKGGYPANAHSFINSIAGLVLSKHGDLDDGARTKQVLDTINKMKFQFGPPGRQRNIRLEVQSWKTDDLGKLYYAAYQTHKPGTPVMTDAVRGSCEVWKKILLPDGFALMNCGFNTLLSLNGEVGMAEGVFGCEVWNFEEHPDDGIGVKCHRGGLYLTVDQEGKLSSAKWCKAHEIFEVEEGRGDGRFALRSRHTGKYLSSTGGEYCGGRSEGMTLKHAIVDADRYNPGKVKACRRIGGSWEAWDLEEHGNGCVSVRSRSQGAFLSATGGSDDVKLISRHGGAGESWRKEYGRDGRFALWNVHAERYLHIDSAGTVKLGPGSDWGACEAFHYDGAGGLETNKRYLQAEQGYERAGGHCMTVRHMFQGDEKLEDKPGQIAPNRVVCQNSWGSSHEEFTVPSVLGNMEYRFDIAELIWVSMVKIQSESGGEWERQ